MKNVLNSLCANKPKRVRVLSFIFSKYVLKNLTWYAEFKYLLTNLVALSKYISDFYECP